MARPRLNTVDYFPMYSHSSKTVEMLENKFGIKGYAFFYKLLQLLATEDGHVYHANTPMDLEFLSQKLNCDVDLAIEMINTLSCWEKIDSDLWNQKIIWYQGFVDTLESVYKKRNRPIPTRDDAIRKVGVSVTETKGTWKIPPKNRLKVPKTSKLENISKNDPVTETGVSVTETIVPVTKTRGTLPVPSQPVAESTQRKGKEKKKKQQAAKKKELSDFTAKPPREGPAAFSKSEKRLIRQITYRRIRKAGKGEPPRLYAQLCKVAREDPAELAGWAEEMTKNRTEVKARWLKRANHRLCRREQARKKVQERNRNEYFKSARSVFKSLPKPHKDELWQRASDYERRVLAEKLKMSHEEALAYPEPKGAIMTRIFSMLKDEGYLKSPADFEKDRKSVV